MALEVSRRAIPIAASLDVVTLAGIEKFGFEIRFLWYIYVERDAQGKVSSCVLCRLRLRGGFKTVMLLCAVYHIDRNVSFVFCVFVLYVRILFFEFHCLRTGNKVETLDFRVGM